MAKRLTIKSVEDYEGTQCLIVKRAEEIIKKRHPYAAICKDGIDIEIRDGIVETRVWFDDSQFDRIRMSIEEFCK